MFHNGLSYALPQRILVEPAPGPAAGALQIDDGDVTVSRLEGCVVKFGRLGHGETSKPRLEAFEPGLEQSSQQWSS